MEDSGKREGRVEEEERVLGCWEWERGGGGEERMEGKREGE